MILLLCEHSLLFTGIFVPDLAHQFLLDQAGLRRGVTVAHGRGASLRGPYPAVVA